MTALAEPPTLFDGARVAGPAHEEPKPICTAAAVQDTEAAGGETTLDDLLSGAWQELVAYRPVSCPMCGELMRPEHVAHGLSIAGRCRNCGTTLS